MIHLQPYEIITDDVFLQLSRIQPGCEVFLKLEGLNPSGSVKLKTAVGLIQDAEQRGLLGPGSRIIESSSGNLGLALASICTAKGYRFTCVVDPNTASSSMDQMRALGAEVVVVDWKDANGGYLESRISYIRTRLVAEPATVWLNQYANPANPRVHYEHTARSILKELGQLDYLFVGTGSSGTFVGCAEHLREHSPATKIVAVDAEGSVIFGTPPGPRSIPGLGASRRPELFRPELADEFLLVPEIEAVRACRRMAREHGLLVGGSTGSVLAAIRGYAPGFAAGSRIAAISPDLGERYLRTIYDDTWVAERISGAQPGPATLDPFAPVPALVPQPTMARVAV